MSNFWNSTTKKYTSQLNGSWDWVIEGVARCDFSEYTTYSDVWVWSQWLIENAIDAACNEIEQKAKTKNFPCQGWSTAHIYDNYKQYVNEHYEIACEEIEAEQKDLFMFLLDWLTKPESED